MIISSEERKRERELFESERAKFPELFVREPLIDTDELLRSIGIKGLDNRHRPVGYLKLLPQDFIVEEVMPDGQVVTIDPEPLISNLEGEGATYYTDVVKVNVSTLDVKSELAKLWQIDEKGIGYAGIKDKRAITSQRLSVRGLTEVAASSAFERVVFENFFLKSVWRGKGAINAGTLKGNRFTITVRTDRPMSHEFVAMMKDQIARMKLSGFLNYFYTQRFGTPRLISHLLGELLIQGKYEDTVKFFVTHCGSRELPYFQRIRTSVREQWGDWRAVRELIERFPSHFGHELMFVDHLIAHPQDFLGALQRLPDQVRLWVYAFSSYLFNRELSLRAQAGDAYVPASLPLVPSMKTSDWSAYYYSKQPQYMQPLRQMYADFPFINFKSHAISTRQSVEIHKVAAQRDLVVFAFTLPKGSYATTFLMNFFQLASGLPLVPGVELRDVDAKELVGMGSARDVYAKFATVIEESKKDIVGGMGKSGSGGENSRG